MSDAEQYRDLMTKLARLVDSLFNEGAKGARRTRFVLLTFQFGDKGHCNYVSNCNRHDVVTLLKEQLARFEGSPDQTGHA